MELINSFKRYLINTVPKIVVKDRVAAEAAETMTSRRNGDYYVAASLKIDTFLSFVSYSREIIQRAGITDIATAIACSNNKFLIPQQYRDAVVQAQRDYITANFEETNEYYRMIAGMKAIGQESIMLPPSELRRYGFTGDTPVALDELEPAILSFMETDGFLATLAQRYPAHKYIPYMATRKVDIVVARRAEDYQLLYTPRLENGYRFYRDFISFYEDARQYFLTVVYNHAYESQYTYYHSFIGFMILHMAIQRTLNSTFKVMADRDFYDLETVRVFLDAYSIPFIDLFTLAQQKLLCKNLNILLRQKADVQVLYDVLDLLGYDNYELLKYMLVKQHRLYQENDEALPVPVFYYRTVVDDNGTTVLELDRTSMYEYYFVGVPMDETDVVIEDFEDVDAYEYHEFVDGDPTWIQDNELALALENMQMNYVETKYAALNLVFRMQEINFELTYLSRLILDKKAQTSYLTVEMSLITNRPVSLFNVWILLICLICKRNEIIPDIIKNPSMTLAIWGYNFQSDFNKIKEEVKSHPELYDQDVLDHIDNFQFGTIQDVNYAYRHVREVASILTEVMQETDDPDVYHANAMLYNTLLLTERNTELYTMSNGEVADLYSDYLADAAPDLYEFYEGIETPEECIDYINYIATKMSTLLEDTEYLVYLNPVDINLINAILTILRAFKSYTIDIKDITVEYQFDSRLHNLMKLMDKAWFKVYLKYSDNAIRYNDAIHVFESYIKENSKMLLADGWFSSVTVRNHSAMIMPDLLKRFEQMSLKASDQLGTEDGIHVVESNIKAQSKADFRDSFTFEWVDHTP